MPCVNSGTGQCMDFRMGVIISPSCLLCLPRSRDLTPPRFASPGFRANRSTYDVWPLFWVPDLGPVGPSPTATMPEQFLDEWIKQTGTSPQIQHADPDNFRCSMCYCANVAKSHHRRSACNACPSSLCSRVNPTSRDRRPHRLSGIPPGTCSGQTPLILELNRFRLYPRQYLQARPPQSSSLRQLEPRNLHLPKQF